MSKDFIFIKGARQNNLKNLRLRLPLNELTVVTGVSGSGKSSLAFDTVYSEGQRRYVETFSPYARQFLDRMDKPQVDRIEGIPPAIAIDQTNPVRTSRSTVGTMTELNDYLKLLFARVGQLYCRGCGQRVGRDTPESIFKKVLKTASPKETPAILLTFPVRIPGNFSGEEIQSLLFRQGYTRIHLYRGDLLEVIQDRIPVNPQMRSRMVEGLEACMRNGNGLVCVYPVDHRGEARKPFRYSSDFHCADCSIHYTDPIPSLFSFNSPVGACNRCRGFGRTLGIDWDLVVPDVTKTLAEGAVKPWQTESYLECQKDLLRFASRRGIPVHLPWKKLSEAHKTWVLEGEGSWEEKKWYGVRRFFDWLETKSYKMHIRVLLSKYRSYDTCTACKGTRLKSDALLWRVGTGEDIKSVISQYRRVQGAGPEVPEIPLSTLPGLSIHDVALLPLDRCEAFFKRISFSHSMDEATDLLLKEIRSRLRYLVEVGLGYLNLDRQSRTLSGGEVQRINLTTALGTSLINTLFVLDEPSIGLHSRDIQRLIGILLRLRQAGNSLMVVEHDPQIMLSADRILDLGPGPGERGGRVVFQGTPNELLRSKRSLTAAYLAGKKRVVPGDHGGPSSPPKAFLEVYGVRENNLKNIDLKIPINRMVCVTGVSGSGKSTLVQDVLFKALRKIKGKPMEVPGKYRDLQGHDRFDEVILADQSPIGRTTRSNPASYVGALDPIRKAFAEAPLARERQYTPGTFSFNSGSGRCPTCGGNGFEHVEMQFLSDVYLRCPDCDGKRYRPEVLDVKLIPNLQRRRKGRGRTGQSIAEVLDMTVSEALVFFRGNPDICRSLEPLNAIGLNYMKLGQPVSTLSGGEAQRLKLAGHLARARKERGRDIPNLFLFDEPTTGLHFSDIAKLVSALRTLVREGHSVVVIEHQLDVIRSADWIVDLGPEGGEDGGYVVCEGTPLDVSKTDRSHTGSALREYEKALERTVRPFSFNPPGRGRGAIGRRHRLNGGKGRFIRIHNARHHNLKGIDVQIPRGRFTVITGVSGSGKSSLAFDILFSEGQRRYLDALNAYARQFVQPATRPDVDAIFGIPPTVANEQRTSRGGRKSTVATLTEIYHFLRLLFVKLGTQYCPNCRVPIEPQSREAILAKVMRDFRGGEVEILSPLVVSRKGYYTELAKWARGKGYPILRVDGIAKSTDSWPRLDRFKEHNIEIPVGRVKVHPKREIEMQELFSRALEFGRGLVRIAPGEVLFSVRRACPRCERSFSDLDPRMFSFNSRHGWCSRCFGTGVALRGFDAEQSGEEVWWNEWLEGEPRVCPSCNGKRLNPEALSVRFRNQNIGELTSMSIREAERYFRDIALNERESLIARDILRELKTRLLFLREVGLGYLTLSRSAPTLSGGEAQRIRLAAQLGSNLKGVCYVLDEPTIGLHPRDTRLLLQTLMKLKFKGNTVVVVEHDEETIRCADYLIDLGPGAGSNGGRVVSEGTVKTAMNNRESETGRFLKNPLRHPLFENTKGGLAGSRMPAIKIIGAELNNLKKVTVTVPLGGLVCVTGVSGSGKSTFVREVLYRNLKFLFQGKGGGRKRVGKILWNGCRKLEGWQRIRRVLEVDQSPIGKTPRSCPATYVGFWEDIRRLFSEIPESRMRGYGPGRFSFNIRGGRCEACEGQGIKKIEMNFLPDVHVCCEVCGGARFTLETLAVRYKEKNIADILSMSVEEAEEFFISHYRTHRALRLLNEVGLGYLTLGQQSPTLSGGEAQRIKLVTELVKARPTDEDRFTRTGKEDAGGGKPDQTLYVLDEPTIGLHMADVEKLLGVLRRLVSSGNTVVIIEHNLDVIAEADWVIDLGPEGGDRGGYVVAQGPPEAVAKAGKNSYTGKILGRFLTARRIRPSVKKDRAI